MWPFADLSLEWATFWGDAANIALIACLIGGVLATFIIVRTTSVKEHHWEVDRGASKERVIQLETQQEASKALIAEANARALEARVALEKFKAHRSLTPEQQGRIAGKLKPFAGQEYALSVATGSESEDLMCLIDEILTAAEWKKQPAFMPITVDTRCGTVGVNTLSGVHIRVSDKAEFNVQQRVVEFVQALNDEDIATQGAKDPKNIPSPTIVYVMIGNKPQ